MKNTHLKTKLGIGILGAVGLAFTAAAQQEEATTDTNPAVTIDISIPNHPMIPKLIIIGKILGTMAISPTLLDKKRRNMIPKTRTMVMERLLICPLVK